jgi:hypothetical protein
MAPQTTVSLLLLAFSGLSSAGWTLKIEGGKATVPAFVGHPLHGVTASVVAANAPTTTYAAGCKPTAASDERCLVPTMDVTVISSSIFKAIMTYNEGSMTRSADCTVQGGGDATCKIEEHGKTKKAHIPMDVSLSTISRYDAGDVSRMMGRMVVTGGVEKINNQATTTTTSTSTSTSTSTTKGSTTTPAPATTTVTQTPTTTAAHKNDAIQWSDGNFMLAGAGGLALGSFMWFL